MYSKTQKKSHRTKNASQPKTPIPGHIQARLEKIWQQAYSAQTQEDLVQLYADWSDSYDEDHDAVGFFGHISATSLLADLIDQPDDVCILDAGAGTGAAGVQLAKLGFENIVGIDLSADMLAKAKEKNVYRKLLQADLGYPVDAFQNDSFDAAILVGVFSYGQAPAWSLDEIIRLVKPGGVVVFTMRTDFFESDAMSVRSKMEELSEIEAWEEIQVTDPESYLPNKDPDAQFRVWCFRVLESNDSPDGEFVEAVKEAFSSESPIKRFDHRHIWNSTASRLYNRYIECPEYYLNDSEEDILQAYTGDIIGPEHHIVELGCGNADKIKHLLEAFPNHKNGSDLIYSPIDLSPGAIEATQEEIEHHFGETVLVNPILASFDEALSKMPKNHYKLILFFGSSIGNLETIEETIDFLAMVRRHMSPGDRFLVGMDLHKPEEILHQAYQAGEPNRQFFLNIIRRMNDELGGEFDLDSFIQATSYDQGTPHKGIQDRCVNFKLVTQERQQTHLKEIDMQVELSPGEGVQVGISRKFCKKDIELLAAESGFELRRQWLDRHGYFSLNELVPVHGNLVPVEESR